MEIKIIVNERGNPPGKLADVELHFTAGPVPFVGLKLIGFAVWERRSGSGGKSYREIMGKPIPSIPAFREPGPRLEVMDELGLDYALMFPTLASLVEERLKDDPEAIHDVVHALNQWMYETWSFNYEDRIFATPVITLPIVDRALEELEWCLERGAKTVLVRPAPVPGFRGSRSFVSRIMVAWITLRLTIEEKLEPIFEESEELLARYAPQLAAFI